MHVHAPDPVLTRHALFRRTAERIEVLGNASGTEADSLQQRDELCLRQSAGDSTGPQIDVPPDRFGQLTSHDDVRIEELATRCEHAEDLPERLLLVRREIQHAFKVRR